MRTLRMERGEALLARVRLFQFHLSTSMGLKNPNGNSFGDQIKAPTLEYCQGTQFGMGWASNRCGPAVRDHQGRILNGAPRDGALVGSKKQYQGRPMGGGNTACRPQEGAAYGPEGQMQMPKDHGVDGGRKSSTLSETITGWEPLTSEVFGRKLDGLCGSKVMSRTISPLTVGDNCLLPANNDGQNTDCASSDIIPSTTTPTTNNTNKLKIPTNNFNGNHHLLSTSSNYTIPQNLSSSPHITTTTNPNPNPTHTSTSSSAKIHVYFDNCVLALGSPRGRYSPSRNKHQRNLFVCGDHTIPKHRGHSIGRIANGFDESFESGHFVEGPSLQLQRHSLAKSNGFVPIHFPIHALKVRGREGGYTDDGVYRMARRLVGVRGGTCARFLPRKASSPTSSARSVFAGSV